MNLMFPLFFVIMRYFLECGIDQGIDCILDRYAKSSTSGFQNISVQDGSTLEAKPYYI